MIYLGIGSNLGNKRLNIEKVKFKIIENNIKILQSSNYYESLSWPNKKNPKFLNIVLKISTNLKPTKLIKIFQNIENSLGRKKAPRNSPRICDIDIIDFNNSCKSIIHKGKKIVTPHPRMHQRNFTLIPLYEIKKNWVHPKSKQKIDILIKSQKLQIILPKSSLKTLFLYRYKFSMSNKLLKTRRVIDKHLH